LQGSKVLKTQGENRYLPPINQQIKVCRLMVFKNSQYKQIYPVEWVG